MERARRAGLTGGEGVEGASCSPRRAVAAAEVLPVAPGLRRGRMSRLVAAPLAMLTVVGLAAAVLVAPSGAEPFVLTDPQYAAAGAVSTSPTTSADSGIVSRDEGRPSLLASDAVIPSISATPTPSASASTGASASPSVSPSASASASAEEETASPTPEETTEPAVDYSAVAEADGTLYASASVNVRTGPGTGYDVRTTLAEGDEVEVTSWTDDGWRQVVVADRAGWIKESFLTDEEPVPVVTSDSSSSASGISTAACSAASGAESGLTSRTVDVLRAVCNAFPSVTSYGGYRADGDSYHGSGRAIDVMTSGEAGWEIARWVRANASELGVIEVIYSQQIWTTERSAEGWRWMSDRGSASANHYDHVHISVA